MVRGDRRRRARQDHGGRPIEEIPLPDRPAKPHAIVATAPGECWFTEWGANRVGRLTPAGASAEYDLPTPSSEPHGIAVGPDGALWTALETGAVARVAPAPVPADPEPGDDAWPERPRQDPS